MFVRSFKNGNNDPISNTFDKHCMLLVEIKDFDALIDNKLFFDRPSKKKQEEYENLVEMSSWNVKNGWLYTRKLFTPSKLL